MVDRLESTVRLVQILKLHLQHMDLASTEFLWFNILSSCRVDYALRANPPLN